MDNLSVSGCRVAYRLGWLAPGEPVTVRLSGKVNVDGEIAWIFRDCVGVRFAEPLSPAIVLDARLP